MAPVGADFVVLLNRLIQISNTDKLEKVFLECATSLLQKLYMDFTMRILPRVIGTKRLHLYVVCTFRTKYLREDTDLVSKWGRLDYY